MFGSLWSYLKRRWMRIKGAFPILWKNYIYQSLLAAIVVFIILLILTIENAVVIASIGATAFIIFTMPRNITAKPRRVIGGHMVGLLSGSLCSLIPHSSTLASISVFALGVAITGFSPGVIIAVVTSSIVLSLAHHFSKNFLKDLT